MFALTRWRLAIPIVLLLLGLSTSGVSAHASLVNTYPAPSAILAQPPDHVQLWFDEQVDPQFSEVQVLDAARVRVDAGSLQLAPDDPKSLVAPLKPLGGGTFSVVWKAFSATDGHITRGVYAFSVGQAAGPVIASSDSNSGASELSPLSALAHGFSLLSLLALAGGFFFRLVLLERSLQSVGGDAPSSPTLAGQEAQSASFAPAGAREALAGRVESRYLQIMAVALALAFVANAVELLIQSNLMTGEISPQNLAEVLFDTRLGVLWLSRVLSLIVMATILFAHTRRARILIPTLSLAAVLGLYLIANSLALTHSFFLSALWPTPGLTPAQALYLYAHHLGLVLAFVLFLALAFYQKYNLGGLLPVFGALALLTRSLSSHGAAAEGDLSVAVLSDWVHLLAVAWWVGGLFYFAFLLPTVWGVLDPVRRGRWLSQLVTQFSVVGLVSTPVIALTGLYNSTLQVPSLGALWQTLYGDTLLVKVVLFGLMLALGAVNLLLLGPRFRQARAEPEKSAQVMSHLRITLGAEVLLGLSAILLAGLLTIEPPARAETLTTAQPVAQTTRTVLAGQVAPDARVTLVIGQNQFDARVADANDQPAPNILRVIFNFTLLDSDAGTQNVTAEPDADGHYSVNGNYLALDGMWRIRVIVRRQGVEDVSVEFPFYVPSPMKPDDAQARAQLVQSEKSMDALSSLRSTEILNDGANGIVVTNYEFRAPDRMRFNIQGEGASIAIGQVQFYQDRTGQWTPRARVDPYQFKFDLSKQALWVQLGRSETLNDEPAQIVRFDTPSGSGSGAIHYAYWISTRNQRLLQYAMVTDGHYMMEYYHDFNAPDIVINSPESVSTPTPLPTPVPQGQGASGRSRGFITGDLEGDGALVLFVVGIAAGLLGASKRLARQVRLTAFVLAAVLAFAGIALFADAVNSTTTSASRAPVDATRAARGQALYQDYCAACHGAQGKGDGPAGAQLPVRPFDLTTHVLLHDEQYLHAVILDGRGYMPAFGDRLSQDNILDVIAYIRQLALEAQNTKPAFTPNP